MRLTKTLVLAIVLGTLSSSAALANRWGRVPPRVAFREARLGYGPYGYAAPYGYGVGGFRRPAFADYGYAGPNCYDPCWNNGYYSAPQSPVYVNEPRYSYPNQGGYSLAPTPTPTPTAPEVAPPPPAEAPLSPEAPLPAPEPTLQPVRPLR